MKQYFLDGIEITSLVSFEYKTPEEVSLVGEDILKLPQFSIELWNEDDCLNPHNPASIFFGSDILNRMFAIIEDEQEVYKGRIGEFNLNQEENICEISSNSLFSELLDRTCIYVANNITPVEAVEEILILNGLLSYIDEHSFHFSKAIQLEMGLLVDINFLLDSATSVSNVLQQLATLSAADIYYSQGKIHFVQYKEGDDIIPALVIPSSVIGKFKLITNQDNIRNQYSYTVNVGGSDINLKDAYIGTNSRNIWGERSYSGISLSSANNISSQSIVGLIESGTQRILRAQYPRRYCEFSILNNEYPYPLAVNDLFLFDNQMGSQISLHNWQIIKVEHEDFSTTIKAVECG